MTRLADYVVRFMAAKGIEDLFLVAGGGIMHLLDAVGRSQDLRYVCNSHEQASAVCAEGYSRMRGLGACLVTVGPGGVNALSGAAGAWYDSIPTLVVSGQVRRELIADYAVLRQKGPQEGNVVTMAAPVTKSARTVLDPRNIRYELERAVHAATSGRPGPAWIDIPLDVQGAEIEERDLPGFTPPEAAGTDPASLREEARAVLGALRAARRPLLVPGNGVHLAGARALLEEFLERVRIPVVCPDSAKDLVAEDHPLAVGIFGNAGQRRANFAIQTCDLLLGLGAGLSVKKVGFNVQGFAPAARKILVDIDEGQLRHQTVKPDLAVLADARAFLQALLVELGPQRIEAPTVWQRACAEWKRRYPIAPANDVRRGAFVQTYDVADRLANALDATDVLVTGNGTDWASCIQSFRCRPGQRVITSGNWGPMGWDLPLAIGSCIGGGRRRTVLVTGDGSIQWNVQELLTIRHNDLPIKVLVLNNRGYASIRSTQNSYFSGRFVGADPSSGVSNPDFSHLAAAYGLPFVRIPDPASLDEGIARALASEGPALCEVLVSPEQGISPRVSSFRRPDGSFEPRPLHDMFPFLSREELRESMLLSVNDEPDAAPAPGAPK